MFGPLILVSTAHHRVLMGAGVPPRWFPRRTPHSLCDAAAHAALGDKGYGLPRPVECWRICKPDLRVSCYKSPRREGN